MLNPKPSLLTPSPTRQLLTAVMLMFWMMAISQWLVPVAFEFMTGMTYSAINHIELHQITNKITNALMLSNTIGNTLVFLSSSLFFLVIHEKRSLFQIQKQKWNSKKTVVLGVLTSILFLTLIPPSASLHEWTNIFLKSIDLGPVSRAIAELDQQQKVIYAVIDNIKTPVSFIIATIGIAIAPAVGEELFFRGVIQNLLIKSSSKPIISILFTALLFSAIHANIGGFLPRFLVGFILGMIYHKSGNILFPILGHFCFNFFQVLFTLIQNMNRVSEPTSDEKPISLLLVGISAVIAIFIYWVFSKQTKEYEPTIQHESLGKDILK